MAGSPEAEASQRRKAHQEEDPGWDGLAPHSNLEFTSLESDWAKENEVCAIDSWNLNAWHAGQAQAANSTADVMLVQETRLPEDEQCRRAEDAAKRKGWQATFNAAIRTEKGGSSAGVGILAKKHIGMRAKWSLPRGSAPE